MKKILAFLFTFSLLCSFATNLQANDFTQASTYIDVTENEDHTLTVSLYIDTYVDMDVAGLSFTISYLYNNNNYLFPLSPDENISIFDSRFSNAVIGYDPATGELNYIWTDSPVSVSADEQILLAEFSYDIAEDAPDGEYLFHLRCNEFYRDRTENDTEVDVTPDVYVDVFSDDISVWIGEKLEAYGNDFEIIVSGSKEKPFSIFVNKNISPDYCFVDNIRIAQITEIENYENNSGARIDIVGKNIGSTNLTITGGYNNSEDVTVSIKVIDRSPMMLSINKAPSKTTYKADETLDLTGLELQVQYDNDDIENIAYSPQNTSEFVVDAYDFSTAGEKRIKVSYGDLYVYVKVLVETDAPVEPDTPPHILYGDGNDDSLVDTKDLVLLRRYLANYNFDTGLSTVTIGDGGDANGDGAIDTKDLVLIRRYFANYNYDTGSSTVVLGPQN